MKVIVIAGTQSGVGKVGVCCRQLSLSALDSPFVSRQRLYWPLTRGSLVNNTRTRTSLTHVHQSSVALGLMAALRCVKRLSELSRCLLTKSPHIHTRVRSDTELADCACRRSKLDQARGVALSH